MGFTPKQGRLIFIQQTSYIKLAFGYLSRLPLGRSATSEEMGQALSWLPLVGLSLGLIALAPLTFFDIFVKYPLLQAWGYSLLLLWLTRATHLDGFADILDALGSGKSGEEFFTVMKDSRVGVFGATGITLTVLGMISMSYYLFDAGKLAPFFIAPMLSRTTPYVLSLTTRVHPNANLGKLIELVPQKLSVVVILLALFLALLFLSFTALFLSILLLCLLIAYTHTIANKEGGYSGDYLGFTITAGELCVLFSCLICT